MAKAITLYKKGNDGQVRILEIYPENYYDRDELNEALSFYYEKGYCDSREEAEESEIIV